MGILNFLLGGGANKVGHAVQKIGGVFKPNAEANAQRMHEYQNTTLNQYASEFHTRNNRTWFDSLADGLNRLVRPMITLMVLTPIVYAQIDPERLAIGIQALALLPTGYWALLSIVIGFYFGGRMQLKAQDFRKSIDDAVARAPQVIENMKRLRGHLTPGEADEDYKELEIEVENKAVMEWRKKRGHK